MAERNDAGLYVVSLNWVQINALDHILYDVVCDRMAIVIKQKGFEYKEAVQLRMLVHRIWEKFPTSAMEDDSETYSFELTRTQARIIKLCMYFCMKDIYSGCMMNRIEEIEDILDEFVGNGYKTLKDPR